MNNLYVHFDVPKHEVTLHAFIESARSAERTIAAINREVFSNSLEIELLVASPETGSVKQVLKVIIKGFNYSGGIIAFLLMVAETDLGKESIRELTGKYPVEHAVEGIRKLQEKSESLEGKQTEETDETEKEACAIVERFVVSATGNALSLERDAIDKLEISEGTRFEIADAQSGMFEACLQDERINGIGFSEEDDFPINRSSFAARAVKPVRIDKEDADKPEYKVELVELLITSPNFREQDQEGRQWKAELANGSSCFFIVADKQFWSRLHSKEFSFGEGTKVRAQWVIKTVKGKVRSRTVLRVLAVDSVRLAEPLDRNAIEAAVGDIQSSGESPSQGELF
ncbi:MAG: hypothetical protein AAGA38_09815 [Pseudomonadota bacterium]